jgi:hypothetical protein
MELKCPNCQSDDCKYDNKEQYSDTLIESWICEQCGLKFSVLYQWEIWSITPIICFDCDDYDPGNECVCQKCEKIQKALDKS